MSHLRPVPPGDSPDGPGDLPGPTSGPDLAVLLKRCALGDEAAFGAFYDATSTRIFGLVLRILRDRAQAEEVTQEVFLDLWRQSARFDPRRGSAVSWAMTIAHRAAVDRVRSAQSSSDREDRWGQREQSVPHDSTAEIVQERLEARRVRAALESLTPTQKTAVELAYFGGYTHTEVAAMMEVPVGTAKTRIRDGLIRLRDAMGVTA